MCIVCPTVRYRRPAERRAGPLARPGMWPTPQGQRRASHLPPEPLVQTRKRVRGHRRPVGRVGQPPRPVPGPDEPLLRAGATTRRTGCPTAGSLRVRRRPPAVAAPRVRHHDRVLRERAVGAGPTRYAKPDDPRRRDTRSMRVWAQFRRHSSDPKGAAVSTIATAAATRRGSCRAERRPGRRPRRR